jgi:hypothetical protein
VISRSRAAAYSASGPQLRSLKGDGADHAERIRGEENSSMADECGGPSTTSRLHLRLVGPSSIVRRGGRLRKALVGRREPRAGKKERRDGDRVIREGTIAECSCIQYSMHRRVVCVVVVAAGALRPVHSSSRRAFFPERRPGYRRDAAPPGNCPPERKY